MKTQWVYLLLYSTNPKPKGGLGTSIPLPAQANLIPAVKGRAI